jgi:hypothetical protein
MILGKYGNPSAILRLNDMDKASLPNASTLPLQVARYGSGPLSVANP